MKREPRLAPMDRFPGWRQHLAGSDEEAVEIPDQLVVCRRVPPRAEGRQQVKPNRRRPPRPTERAMPRRVAARPAWHQTPVFDVGQQGAMEAFRRVRRVEDVTRRGRDAAAGFAWSVLGEEQPPRRRAPWRHPGAHSTLGSSVERRRRGRRHQASAASTLLTGSARSRRRAGPRPEAPDPSHYSPPHRLANTLSCDHDAHDRDHPRPRPRGARGDHPDRRRHHRREHLPRAGRCCARGGVARFARGDLGAVGLARPVRRALLRRAGGGDSGDRWHLRSFSNAPSPERRRRSSSGG